MREKIFKYVKEKYKIKPDYPFSAFPDYPVLRHEDNRKWFVLIMDVPREKLGLKGAEYVDIMNVKLGDPMLVDVLVRQQGYFHGYHIARGNWISILLDGTVPFEELCQWIDESYAVTASKQKKQKMRPGRRRNGSYLLIPVTMILFMLLTMSGKLNGNRAEGLNQGIPYLSMQALLFRRFYINAE